MSLKFYFGAAGSGKSWKLNRDLIEWALANPRKRFLIIVPDQFTMHTQMELVKLHPHRGILNIEVLSFGRLSFRIFEEVGAGKLAVLDDTGKSLILRKIASDISAELPIIGKNLNKPGYIAEVKSALSEFMQYTISPAELKKMIEYADNRGALSAKLRDLHRLYEAFLEYIRDKFITTEETLDLLRASLHKSVVIRDSVVIFDGFTGFTPLQNKVIKELMLLADQVIVSVLMGKEEYEKGNEIKEQSLFYLTGKMVSDLSKLAVEAKVKRQKDICLYDENPKRFLLSESVGTTNHDLSIKGKINHEMLHLEKHLFRYPLVSYVNDTSTDKNNNCSIISGDVSRAIHIMEAPSITAEVRETCLKIKDLTMDHGYSYRDIAIVTADMGAYSGILEREANKYGIPIYLDQTKGILLNPFTEFIRSAIRVVNNNYNYEAVFHFLRSGFVDLSFAEIDKLENYVIGCGIKGRKKYHDLFVRRLSLWREGEYSEKLADLNKTREKIIVSLAPFDQKPKTAGDIIKSLYEFIVAGRIQQKLKAYEESFVQSGDLVRAKEYSQIYRLVMDLLDQIYSLLKDEAMTLKEFADIFDAGLSEIKVGTIPQNIDRVVVGDMERTRLSQVRFLFFLGVNDGNIPVSNSRGGLISDLDREFLKESSWELSPTPRQKMYIQRLYLYMNMTKPSERLYLSYARVDSEGKSLRPSYLIETMKKLFPDLKVDIIENKLTFKQIYGFADSLDTFALSLRNYVISKNGSEFDSGRYETGGDFSEIPDSYFEILTVLGNIYRDDEKYNRILESLLEQAFKYYSHKPLTKEVADLVYGSLLGSSISRLESYAGCAYSHFLQYGLALREREEYAFEAVDLGIVYHGVLEIFAGKLAEQHLTWFDFSDEDGERLLREAVDSYAAQYGETILFGSARNEQMISRIYRIMLRTVRTLRQQLKQGEFQPEFFEAGFTDVSLSPDEKMTLRGQIDRIDICETDSDVYVKVVDYKSGHRTFDLAALYYGLQLQLIVYLNVAVEKARLSYPHKNVIPAAVLYYHVSDPMLSEEAELNPVELEQRLLEKLKMTGIVNEDEGIIKRLDRDFTSKSSVIPVARKKDGAFTSNSSVLGVEDFAVLSDFVNRKIKAMGGAINGGDIAMNPYESKGETGCKYCGFKFVCGFDLRLPGYGTRKLKVLKWDEVLDLMREGDV